jgi:glycosyltransferase involved in cell wall biosynthesis
MELVAVMFVRLGPYHAARMRGAGQVLGRERCIAVEMASLTREYEWDAVETSDFRRRTLFQDVEYEAIPARARARALVSALEELQPSAVAINGWSSREARAALRWCRRRRRAAILMSESQRSDAVRSWPPELVKRFIVRKFDAALVGGRTHASYLEALGMSADQIAFGYDVVDNEYFAQGAARARERADELRARLALPKRYFLASARFIEKKNLPFLVEAFGRYSADTGPDGFHLVVLGDGPGRPELERKVQEIRLGDRVHFPGFKQYQELPMYYGLAEAFVLPSLVEPWGLVVNEAMAAGLPVLVSRACGSAELIVEGENGFTFDPGDAGALAQLIASTTANSGVLTRMGEAGRELIAARGPIQFGQGLRRASELGSARAAV